MNSENQLSLKQIAERSSESVHVWRKRIYRREIAHIKSGRNVRVRESDYLAWVQERVVPAARDGLVAPNVTTSRFSTGGSIYPDLYNPNGGGSVQARKRFGVD